MDAYSAAVAGSESQRLNSFIFPSTCFFFYRLSDPEGFRADGLKCSSSSLSMCFYYAAGINYLPECLQLPAERQLPVSCTCKITSRQLNLSVNFVSTITTARTGIGSHSFNNKHNLSAHKMAEIYHAPILPPHICTHSTHPSTWQGIMHSKDTTRILCTRQ